MTPQDLDTRETYLSVSEIADLMAGIPQPITTDILEVLLQNAKAGAMPVTIVAQTCPRLNVNGTNGEAQPPVFNNGLRGKARVSNVLKRSVVNGMIQTSWTNAMRKATGDDTFVAGERAWGEHREVDDKPRTCLIDHTPETGPNAGKKTVYMTIMVRRSLGCEYLLRDGTAVDPELVKPFLPAKKSEPVITRDYTLTNVERVSINKQIYIIIGTPAYEDWARRQSAA